MADPSVAQAQGAIPAPVIAQCSAAGNASALPECLRAGAVGFEMLEVARSDRFYGEAAVPVIDACTARNDTFGTTWSCFEDAAGTAAETQRLIGLENIADRCVAAISDPALHAEIRDLEAATQRARFPGQMPAGDGRFRAFEGCPASASQASQAPLAPVGANRRPFDAAACAAYREMEGVIASSSADALRTMKEQAEALEQPAPQDIADVFGISPGAASALLTGGQALAMTTATLVGAFLNTHHPELLMEVFEDQDMIPAGPALAAGNEMARTVLLSIIEQAEQTYRSNCKAS